MYNTGNGTITSETVCTMSQNEEAGMDTLGLDASHWMLMTNGDGTQMLGCCSVATVGLVVQSERCSRRIAADIGAVEYDCGTDCMGGVRTWIEARVRANDRCDASCR